MMGDYQVRFCERLGGVTPPCLLGEQMVEDPLLKFKSDLVILFLPSPLTFDP